ncbi:hypothetical protein CFN16_11405 [Pseudomonas fluorescens]|uniref:Uncharacterized protein n=1 Tax=Pseudomonas fluorescens TaxID=294 RepID=A0A345UW53_PSEFL|nr:hypothetical protein CFN16_11405 [Pseudomonas fluorescens]
MERAQTLDLAGGRGFFEHNWDWGDIQWGALGVVEVELNRLVRGGDELNELAFVVFILIQNFGCSE